MSLELLTCRRFATAHGDLALWGLPGEGDPIRPVVIAITSAFADANFMSGLPVALAAQADAFLMHLPGHGAPPLRDPSVATYGAALGDILERIFLDRAVILVGAGLGAVVALATKAAQVQRLILAEPLLEADGLWPIETDLRRRFAEDPAGRPFITGMFGLTGGGQNAREYVDLVGEISAQTDVWLGAEPLLPKRPISSAPSLVYGKGRAALEHHPRVTTHIPPGSGHDALLRDLTTFEAVLRGACENLTLPPIARSLVHRTPLTARRILYVGEAEPAVRAALLRLAPRAEVMIAGGLDQIPTAADFDCVVTASALPEAVAGLAAKLRPEGDLVCYGMAGDAEGFIALRAAIEAAGLVFISAHDPGEDVRLDDVRNDRTAQFEQGRVEGPLVLTLRKAAARPNRLIIHTVAHAPFRMDIRTRLPTEGLRSLPDLTVALVEAPVQLPPAAVSTPKIAVLQRPGARGFDLWRAQLAQSIHRGWISVIEFDDHPQMAAARNGDAVDLTPFGWAHAVQTSTPILEPLFEPWNAEVRAFPNAAFDLRPFAPRRGPHRVFYGALRRGGFAVEVAAALAQVTAEFPETEFLVVADREVFEALPTRRKRYFELQTYANYLELMSRCSISLSPVEDDPLLDTKSDAKFIDAGSRGVLIIASPRIYRNTIRHEETGLIAQTLGDWPKLLRRVLQDEGLLNKLALAAWRYVRDERMFAGQAADRLAWYRSLWDRRERLTVDMLKRVPGLAEELKALRG